MPAAEAALGIDLGGSKIEALLLDASGQPAWRERVPTPQGDYRATLQAIADLVVRAAGAAAGRFTVGIGHPGSLNAEGLVKNANSTCMNGQPLQRDLEQLLARPVRLANDANCLAMSEASDGAAAGADVVFAVILGTGCGAGISVGGRVLHGANGIAGEWGHNPLPWAEPGVDAQSACYCGQAGCLETLLSGPGLARDHARCTGVELSAEQIHAAARAGHADALATLERHASRLARALAAVINVLDPEVIVLGGGLSQMPHLYTRVPQLWRRWVFSAGVADPVRTRLVPSLHGDASGVRGAALLWQHRGG